MPALSLPKTLDKISDIAREAGALLRGAFAGDMAMDTKSTEIDLVTEYDRRAEAMILNLLRADFPKHGIVAEESGRTDQPDSPYRWFIDPIDGTVNFAHGLPHFCISIGLYRNGQPLIGVVYDPMRDELFTATAGGGAHLIGPDGQTTPLRVSIANALVRSVIATGFAYDKHKNPKNNLPQFCAMTKRVRGIRRFGSAALDMAYVAAGRFDGYWEFRLNAWDVAAGALLVTEAGGTVTTAEGEPFDIDDHRLALIVSNGHIHDEMRDVLGSC